MERNLEASNVCMVCFYDPTKEEEQPDKFEIVVCDSEHTDDGVKKAGHEMCTDCYEGWRFKSGNGTCPACKLPWTQNIAHYPQRLRDRIQGGDHVVTAENIKSKLRGDRPDYGLAEHLISRIEPGFDFYIAGGESLFFYVILEKNPDIFDKLLSKAKETGNSHLYLEANVRSRRHEEFGLIYTALQWACAYGWPYAIQELVRNHADPNFHLGHCPPLHIALQFHNEASAEMVCVMGARVDMVDEYGLGPLFYFSPNILSNAYWKWMEGPEDEDILTEPGKSMARQRAMSTLAFEIDTSLKLLSEMCRQGADVNQFGVFPRTQSQGYSTQENLERWRQSATMVTPLFAILANQHDVHGSNNNGRRFRDQPELQAECWEALGNWMVEVTKIFARSGCDMYGRIHGGETLLYWVERWSEESQTVPCRLAYAKVLQHLRSGTSAFEAFRPWLQMLPLQPR